MKPRLNLSPIAAGVALSLLMGASNVMAQEATHFDWMPPESVADSSRASDTGEQIIPEITILKTPMATADVSKFTKKYEIELDKFGIHNDDSHATETAKGLVEALKHAKSIGANYIIFPKGTYLLNAADYPLIIDHKNTIFDLNGATLKQSQDIRKERGMVMLIEIIDGAENVRVTNGKLLGARIRAQIASGLEFQGGKNIEVDNIHTSNFDGNGFVSTATGTQDRAGLLERIIDSVTDKNLKNGGGFDEKGIAVDKADKTRTIKPYDMTRVHSRGEFEVGYSVGYKGYPHANARVYQAYFYDQDMKFISSTKALQYRKTPLPKNAKWMHLEFNQPEIKGNAQGLVVRITTFTPSTNVHVHDNIIANNVALGFSMCGGQKWIIENNQIIGNGGRAPGYGVDFEDGWEFTQDIVMRNNTFKDNISGDLVVVSGSELIFEGNTFEKTVIVWGRPHNYVFKNNMFSGNVTYTTRTGVAKIHDNTYNGGSLKMVFDTKAVADGLYRKPGETVSTPPLLLKNETLNNMKSVSGTYLNFENSTFNNTQFTVGADTLLVRFINNTAKGASIKYDAKGSQVMYQMSGNKGQITETGDGLNRRKPLAR